MKLNEGQYLWPGNNCDGYTGRRHAWMRVKHWSWRHPFKGEVLWRCPNCDDWRPDGGYPDE